ncbi:hypothetical protein Tsubulata_006405 [Turnera subulata]|uniref:POX domain-containing protein n=1 Tax=Turnera subulata TaxID=218843 RepID=A0A9Q0F122_9ROSI|nr:hypothetical protein Tsubulata_006405 [Turnera subulata]
MYLILRPESHVAQQSRRDKLRIQQSLNPVPHLDDEFPGSSSNLDQLCGHPGLHPDLVQVRNVRNGSMLYDPTAISPEILNIVHQEAVGAVVQNNRPIPAEDSSFTIMSGFNGSPKASNSHDPQGTGNWRTLGSPQSYEWMVSYASGSVGGDRNQQKPTFAGDVLSNNARMSSIPPPAQQYPKPGNNGYQGVHLETTLAIPSCDDISGQDTPKQFREVPFFSHSLYQNTLQDIVTSGSIVGNERALLSSYGNQLTGLHFDNASHAWTSRPAQNHHQFSAEPAFVARKTDQELRNIANDANIAQGGLSLSLSSNPPSKVDVITQFGERYEPQSLQSKNSIVKESQDSKLAKCSYSTPMPKSSIASKDFGKSLHDIVGTSTQSFRNTGPLGPFTGYATILKSSRFLKPALELLDEFCSIASPTLMRACDLMQPMQLIQSLVLVVKTIQVSHPPHFTARMKEVLIVELEAVHAILTGRSTNKRRQGSYICRRRQYQQQMQMVASSFESVAGLSAATPYVSLALKAVSRNFRSIKHAILDQLKHVMKALGEDILSSPNTNVNNSGKCDMSISRLNYMDQSFQKYKAAEGASVGYLEPQQHIWRPQRGLPERSVSNWFINARVRVWKPMVEEIYMLETKCLVETNPNSGKNDGSSEGCSQQNGEQSSTTKFGGNAMPSKHVECTGMESLGGGGEEQLDAAEQWRSQEKRSRVEFQVPTSIDGSLMNFLPYHRSRIDSGGGHGAVSLTLGLRQGVENAQQQQLQQQHHEGQLRLQFGGQIVHDFVG